MPVVLENSSNDNFHENVPAEKANYLPLRPLSLEGLPEGSRPENVVRCIELLEHSVSCFFIADICPVEGESCRRTKQVLNHHKLCRIPLKFRNSACSICCQLIALCQNHSNHCQANKGCCAVPHCRNSPESKISQRRMTDYSKGEMSELLKAEYRYVTSKLIEALSLPSKEERMRNIQKLLGSHRFVTMKLLKYIISKKKPVGVVKPVCQADQQILCHPMNKLSISRKGHMSRPKSNIPPVVWKGGVLFIPS